MRTRSRMLPTAAWTAALVAGATLLAASWLADAPDAPPDRPRGTAPGTADSPDGGALALGPLVERAVPAAADGAWTVHPAISGYTDVAGLPDGRWLVLDGAAARVFLLDRDLSVAGSFGGPGDGPGELARPVLMTVHGDTLVAVLDVTGTRLDLFTPRGAFVDRRTVRVPGCVVGLSQELVPDPSGGLAAWGVCPGRHGPAWTAARIGLDGEARVVASESLTRGGATSLPFGRGLLAWDDRLWLGRPDGCFEALPPGPGTVACLPAADAVPLPADLRERLTRPPPGRKATDVPELDLPDVLPPFVTTWWSAAGPVVVVPERDHPDGAALLVRSDGALVALRADGPAFPGREGLLLARDFLDGTGFRTVPW